MNYNILIGGSAGQGIVTLSQLLSKILKRKGYHIFLNKDYMSRIRGGHNFIQIRFGTEQIFSHSPFIDLIIALDKNTVEIHKEKLNENGKIICDESIDVSSDNLFKLPLKEIAKEVGNSKVFGTAAIGAVLKLFSIPLKDINKIFDEFFDSDLSNKNYQALIRGYELINNHFEYVEPQDKNHIMINGNQAVALGALAAGVSFYSAYPMTPSTGIMTYLAHKEEEAGIVVEQAEDEIAAINMAIGASFAGVRAMTGTSGGGFSLMTESLGLAGITETPLVVIDVQRPGPATGLPTRTEQSDLSFVLTASHGEIPRMVISLRSPADAFYQTARALNIAEKYQVLVILLSDQYLADYVQTIEPFDFKKITIERGIADASSVKENEDYKRYKLTETGVSPRLIPGQIENKTVLADSDEHNECGHITESAEVRTNMMEKRMKKQELLKEEIQEPEYLGAESPDILLVGWGSTYGPIKEAVERLNSENIKVGALIFGDVWPLPKESLEKYAKKVKTIVNIEQNYTGQLAKLIRQETGIKCDKSILKYDGRQINFYEIYSKIKSEVL
ncbi:2-oxoacid:acceptor oxidoreductase subunit alpha [Thermohalobacter berrensis]|uniref:2-oxoacid:ferredoxin oxidoreductase subunit alpha n=1 Tax=Thermohalobacter berrensis TaxID=99594 RepID=A0A419T5N7_9FIRM|nr:2-oxoacid:acceptor oxidoreductase subunit alpha [Thermohalobacter berrensis]RKD32746.1 2-oxoacid:ferredoxin oxidoreductase subunit alpha [Thermohalobacter berrensis]